MDKVWAAAAPRFQAYRLVAPGTPSFICQPAACTAHCCHAFSVSLGEPEVERLGRFHALERVDFLELDEERRPVELPMLQPYLLARADNHCKLLTGELGCGAYEGRPNACRLYPHFVVFWDTSGDRALTFPGERTAAAYRAFAEDHESAIVPLLLGHIECPGFTGPPLSEDSWRAIFEQTYHLQYEAV
jgi:Fe-S-cluster containining protein